MFVFVSSSYHSCPHQLHWDSLSGHCSAEPAADKCSHFRMESDQAGSLQKACAPALLFRQYTRAHLTNHFRPFKYYR